jgi:hypothetical protein
MGYHDKYLIKNEHSYGEFAAFEPAPEFEQEEQPGIKSWVYRHELDSEHYDLIWPVMPDFPYPVFIEQMVKQAWKAKTPTKQHPQQQLAGMHRVGHRVPSSTQVEATPELPVGTLKEGLPRNPRAVAAAGAWTRPTDVRDKSVRLVFPEAHEQNLLQKPHLQGVAKDWAQMLKFGRVEGIGFRGDTRDPATIKAYGGFKTPCSRTDDYYLDNAIIPNFKIYLTERFGAGADLIDEAALKTYIQGHKTEGELFVRYEFWRAMMKKEELHLGRAIANEFLKGYTSSSRSTVIAKAFANGQGWVYALWVKGAFLVPEFNTHNWLVHAEQELALPDDVPWYYVYGFRQVSTKGTELKFTGPLYLRTGFHGNHPEIFDKAFELFSGKRQ